MVFHWLITLVMCECDVSVISGKYLLQFHWTGVMWIVIEMILSLPTNLCIETTYLTVLLLILDYGSWCVDCNDICQHSKWLIIRFKSSLLTLMSPQQWVKSWLVKKLCPTNRLTCYCLLNLSLVLPSVCGVFYIFIEGFLFKMFHYTFRLK